MDAVCKRLPPQASYLEMRVQILFAHHAGCWSGAPTVSRAPAPCNVMQPNKGYTHAGVTAELA